MKFTQEDRLDMLQRCFSHFQQITQWLPRQMARALEHEYSAKGIIELLELADSGNIGGYDPRNPKVEESGYDLWDRFLTVLKKYHQRTDIRPECRFTVDALTRYFRTIHQLRDTFFIS